MNPARKVIVWLLLPLAILGTLVLSASATIDLAASHGVPASIAPAAVAMLEIVALAGTLMWVLVERWSLRRDAIITTIAATGVALIAGVHAYGWFGAVFPVFLVAIVHNASRAWREPWTEDQREPLTESQTLPAPRTVQDLVDTQPSTESEEFTEPAPVRALAVARSPEDEQLQRARELVGRGAGRPTLKRELGVTDHRARQILAEVKQA